MPWDSDKSTASDPDSPSADEKLTADEWDAMVADQKDHASRHEEGGSDVISVAVSQIQSFTSNVLDAISGSDISPSSVSTEQSHTGTDPVANVKYHGAEGDGSTDDTQAIQDAIDALADRGGCVYFPQGEYLHGDLTVPDWNEDFLEMGNGITFAGAHQNASVLRYTGTGTAIDATGSSSNRKKVRVRDLTLIADSYDANSVGIDLEYNQRDSGIRDCRVSTFGRGIDLTGDNWTLSIENLSADNCGYGIYGGANALTIRGGGFNRLGDAGIYLLGGTQIQIDGVNIEGDSNDSSISGDGHGIVVDQASAVDIEGCYFESLNGNCVRVESGFDRSTIWGGRFRSDDAGTPDLKVVSMPAEGFTIGGGLLGVQNIDLGGSEDDIFDQVAAINIHASASADPFEGNGGYPGNILDHSNSRISNLTSDSASLGRITSGPIFAGNQDGADADARLDAAIASASAGDYIYLEIATYSADRIIDSRYNIVGQRAGSSGTTISGTWTVTEPTALVSSVRIEGELVLDGVAAEISHINISSQVTISEDRCVGTHLTGQGTVSFESGTGDGSIAAVDGALTVNDPDGNNDTP